MFEEAQSDFYDACAVQFFNEDNSEAEDRFLMLGFSGEARLLIVCQGKRGQGNAIRIISARKATNTDGKYYQGIKL